MAPTRSQRKQRSLARNLGVQGELITERKQLASEVSVAIKDGVIAKDSAARLRYAADLKAVQQVLIRSGLTTRLELDVFSLRHMHENIYPGEGETT